MSEASFLALCRVHTTCPIQTLPCLTHLWFLIEQRLASVLKYAERYSRRLSTCNCPPHIHSVHQELATNSKGNLWELISAQQINIKTCCLQFTVELRTTMSNWTDRHCFTAGIFTWTDVRQEHFQCVSLLANVFQACLSKFREERHATSSFLINP